MLTRDDRDKIVADKWASEHMDLPALYMIDVEPESVYVQHKCNQCGRNFHGAHEICDRCRAEPRFASTIEHDFLAVARAKRAYLAERHRTSFTDHRVKASLAGPMKDVT